MTKPGAQNFYSKQNLLENNMTSQIPARKASGELKHKNCSTETEAGNRVPSSLEFPSLS